MHAALGDPSRPTHQEILEEEHAQLDHAQDVFPRCFHFIEIAHADIHSGIFLDRSNLRQILYAIMTKANWMMY